MVKRLKKIRQLLEKNRVDAVLITNPVNRRYLSGFEGSAGVLLISSGQAYLVTDFRYVDQAAAQAPHFEVKRWKDDLNRFLAGLVEENGWKKIGFESEHVVYSVYKEMEEKLPAGLTPVKKIAENLRMIKGPAEVDVMRRGAKILDRAFEYVQSIAGPGMTEKALALELEIHLLKEGMEEPSFRYIVASGHRGSMPHGTASDKVISEGEMVTLDFGGVFEGYATDMTRTFALGKVDQRQREIYGIVYKAQQKACDALKPGLKCSEADAVARDLISEEGYANYFGHGLGHGVGLETHEQPVLNHRSNTILEAGMVVTVEPGIYIPGWGGVRIEDMLVVTEIGSETLTNSPRDLIIL